MERIHAKAAKKRWVEPIAALFMALATLGTAWCFPPSGPVRNNRLMNEFNAFERRTGLLNVLAEPPQPLSHAVHVNPAPIRGECRQPEDPSHAF